MGGSGGGRGVVGGWREGATGLHQPPFSFQQGGHNEEKWGEFVRLVCNGFFDGVLANYMPILSKSLLCCRARYTERSVMFRGVCVCVVV